MRLSLVFVLGGFIAGLSVSVFFVFFRQRAMAFWVSGVDFPNMEGWLQVNICFCICYNPPANYKVLANGSTRWPTGRGSWPTAQPVGQWVGLGE